MKYSMLLVALLSASTMFAAEQKEPTNMPSNITVLPASAPVTVLPTPVTMVCPDKTSEISDLSDKIESLEAKLGEVTQESEEQVLEENKSMLISVVGQGVAPMNTFSPAQAYALAKRAAVADAYRLIAEKVKGVRIDGQDVIKNMMVKRSTVRTSVNAMVRNANVVETTFKEGLCEVEMEIKLAYSQFAQ